MRFQMRQHRHLPRPVHRDRHADREPHHPSELRTAERSDLQLWEMPPGPGRGIHEQAVQRQQHLGHGRERRNAVLSGLHRVFQAGSVLGWSQGRPERDGHRRGSSLVQRLGSAVDVAAHEEPLWLLPRLQVRWSLLPRRLRHGQFLSRCHPLS